MLNYQHIYLFGQIQIGETGGQLNSYTSPLEANEYYFLVVNCDALTLDTQNLGSNSKPELPLSTRH